MTAPTSWTTELSDGRTVVIGIDPLTDVVTVTPPVSALSPDDACAIAMGLAAASRIAGPRRASRAARQLRASVRQSIEQLAAGIDSDGDR